MAKTNMDHRLKHATKTYGGLLIMGVVAIPIGLIVGAIDAVFGRTLLAIGSFRDTHLALLLPFLALAGLAIVFCYKKWGKNTGRGMSLVFDVFGGSAGREGVAVQIGATVSH